MVRDPALEALVREHLAGVGELAERRMFGGLAWLKGGHLVCAARQGGVLIRLGKGNDAEALTRAGVAPMTMRGRPMSGWVRADAAAFGDDAFAERLIGEALAFVATLSDAP